MATSTQEKKEEGPRSFARFLEQVDDGQAVVEVSAAQHKLMTTLAEVASRGTDAKGTLTLAVRFNAQPNGVVDVAYDISIKDPKRKLGRSTFFLTPGKNLSIENPRQQRLPLRDVVQPKHFTDVEPENDRSVKDV